MAGCTVQVWGIPSDLPPDRVADKLTIHFLRSRNGGGEISDVQVLPGSPAYALITFEALAGNDWALGRCPVSPRYPLPRSHGSAASRPAGVILLFCHNITGGCGKSHMYSLPPCALEGPYFWSVLSHSFGLYLQIFVRVFMVVDYGKFPAGETLLKNLKKGYSSMQFDFDYRSTLCRVKGTFTELQAFSRDLLACLNIKSQPTGERLSSGSSHSARNTRMYDYQQEPDSAAPVDGEALEQLEDFSLVMDSDIYLYIQRFCASEYQGILCQHHVDAVDVSSNDITILYLQPSPGTSGDMDTLQQSRLALQHLYQQLEVNLRKEKLSKGGLNNQELRALTQELQELYPQLLCHEDGKQLDLIGNLVDVSQAK
uniref:NID domain-containing protein n=1 Tax=Phasianus colchicus TaxID=9054 RepID=A0A669PVQ1_PHACC